ncbi:MarR family winged helix-turn-helix transcriptional regulator [Sphingobacterium sp. LRF_L2]|uniref:MarR family winged helix-turn-helix transcriptional regulator n=1 Tax=Sphingobacterium sp. LRF_L2 TaxID=3369421 RepID=UPI003F6281A4
MEYTLLKEVIALLEQFHKEEDKPAKMQTIDGFMHWMYQKVNENSENVLEPEWEGKVNGRSIDSVISTLFVHLSRYAKSYSRSAIYNSSFSTQEEFIYLINLRAFGAMTKMELIKRNIQDKPVGMQIINRLVSQGWVEQKDSETDKRSKMIRITAEGEAILQQQMPKIRQATQIVAGQLSYKEKVQLVCLLDKLDCFHKPIFQENIHSAVLLDHVSSTYFEENKKVKGEEAID